MVSNAFLHLANAREHLKANRIPAAEAELQLVLSIDDAHSEALTLLGVAMMKSGRPADAGDTFEKAIASNHANAEAIGLLAVVRRYQADYAAAASLFQRLIDLGHPSSDVYNQLGSCLLEAGDPVAAGHAFKRAIELNRNSAPAYYNLGMALKQAGNSFETFATFRRAIELDIFFHDAYVQLWQEMRRLLNWSEGLPILEEGIRRHPQSAQMKVMLATAYGKVGRPEKAEKLFQEAIQLDPTAAPPYAHWLQEDGRFEASIPVLLDSIRANPIQAQPYYNLAVAKQFEIDGRPLADLIEPLMEQASIPLEGRMFLQYALARTKEDTRDYESAMRHYDQANDLAYRLYNWDIVHDSAAVEVDQGVLAKLYPKETFERLLPGGSSSSAPLFVVGMIRTGTTLLDQILASHRKIRSAGEQPFWQISAGRVNRRWLESKPRIEDLRNLATLYLSVMKEATKGGATRMTDKMPTNFSHIGLMSATFPNAKFIHIRRSPLDTCLSIYTTFLGSGTQFAYNQENIVGYYRAYMRTMEHWRSVLPPGRMIEIDYEDLVTNKRIVIGEVLDFCGLEWDDACLSHESNLNQVSTPSLWTVRQPVNTASVERWKRYEPWLGKLLELRDLVHPEPVRSS